MRSATEAARRARSASLGVERCAPRSLCSRLYWPSRWPTALEALRLQVLQQSRSDAYVKADKALYSGQKFKCKDGLLTLAISQVNDDYCDCTDGSDEPGTSAIALGFGTD